MTANQQESGVQHLKNPQCGNFSLLDEPWMPVRRASGQFELVRPAAVVSNVETDPIVAFAWGRADFDAASREFLIGLLATAFAPESDEVFEALWRRPPSVDDLTYSFDLFADAFWIDGTGPRFGQDFDLLEEAEALPISAMFIEAPGAITIKKNKDFFQKRNQISFLSRAGAAIALYTLQTYAPSGGLGHRTSLRGGGPLTTLIRPGDSRAPLWRYLWINTPAADSSYPRAANMKTQVFPWLASTHLSEKESAPKVTPASSHCLQSFWGMPRRIRLSWSPNHNRVACPLTGIVDRVVTREFRMLPWGASYKGFEHPLSPHFRKEPRAPLLPVHPQPEGTPYTHWPSLMANADACDVQRPAKSVTAALGRLFLVAEQNQQRPCLFVTGFDMDKMKARAFVESEMPVFTPHPDYRERFLVIVQALVSAADMAATNVTVAILNALGDEKANPRSTPFGAIRESFFQKTENSFYERLEVLESSMRPGENAGITCENARVLWLQKLSNTGISLFDESVCLEDRPGFRLERAILARQGLVWLFSGRGKRGAELYALLSIQPRQLKGKKAAVRRYEHDEHQDAMRRAHQWWERSRYRSGFHAEDRLSLARLRRATLSAALTEKATFDLFRELGYGAADAWRMPRVGALACVLANLREDEARGFGHALGRTAIDDEMTATVSLRRVKRLLDARTDEEVVNAMRAILSILRGRANTLDVITLVLWADDVNVQRSFLFEYFNAWEGMDPVF